MTLMILWGFILLLAIAVIFLVWLQFKNQNDQVVDLEKIQSLDIKVHQLEDNLKKTLEIMQDLAKKMHVQQEALDQTVQKVHQIDGQNVELIALIGKIAKKDGSV